MGSLNPFSDKHFVRKFFKGEEPASATPPPAAPDVTTGGDDEDQDRLKRVGRAQLITSSQRGVLTEAETSNRKLFGV